MTRSKWLVFILSLALLSILTGACSSEAPALMNPRSSPAREIASLGRIFFILGGLIFLLVMAFLVYALRGQREQLRSRFAGTQVVIWGGMIVPGLILLVLFVLNTNVLGRVSAPPDGAASLTVEVTGNQWWWEVKYPDYGVVTANEIYIPVGEPVLLKLSSEDVIHSFWAPELHGKMDLVPGRVNDFWIEADEPGEYLGECAEYCGTQHAKMRFLVIAVSREEFEAGLERMARPARASGMPGEAVFLSASCVQCHTVAGTDASGQLGPDLTHLASRRTIGAGSLPLNRENLSSWVANPQHTKPGALMPPASLEGEDLQLLIDYLLTLE